MDIVYTYGGGEHLTACFNAISTILYGENIIETLLKSMFVFGSLWAGAYIAFYRKYKFPMTWVVWATVITEVVLVPHTKIHVVDLLKNREPRTIERVPVILAAVAGGTSTVGYELTEAFETYFNTPESFQYNKTGSVFASRLIQQTGQLKITDPELIRSMRNFVKQCVILTSMIGIKDSYTVKDIISSDNLWGEIVGKAPESMHFLYYRDGASQHMSCREGAIKLNKLWDTAAAQALSKIGARSGLSKKGTNPGQYIKGFMTEISEEFTKSGGKAEDLLKQEMMMNEIGSVTESLLSEYGSGSGYALARASQQQKSSWLLAGELFAQTMVQLKNVLQAMMICSFVFLVIFIPLPSGWKYLIKYFQFMLAIELWGPLNAVLNMVMLYYTQDGTTGLFSGDKGMSMLTSQAVHNLHSNTVAIAAWLQGLIPFISYGVVQMGSVAIDGLSMNFASATHGAVGSAAGDLVTGNYNVGNVSVGNKSHHNMNGYQHNTSPSHNDGQFHSVMDDGTLRKITADGSAVYTTDGQAISTLGESVRLNDSLNSQISSQKNEAISDMQTYQNELSTGRSAVAREMADSLTRDYYNQSAGTSTHASDGFSQTEVAQKMKQISDRLVNDHGISHQRASEIAAQVAVGGGFGPISASASASESSNSSEVEAFQKAKDMAETMGLTESYEKFERATQDKQEGVSGGKDQSYSKGLSSALEQTHGARESLSKSQQEVQSWIQMESASRNGSLAIDRNLNQEYLEYLAKLPMNPKSPREQQTAMGMDRAKKLIAMDNPQTQRYREGFVRHKTEQLKQGFMGDNIKSLEPSREVSKPIESGSLQGARNELQGRKFSKGENVSQSIDLDREIYREKQEKLSEKSPQILYNEQHKTHEKKEEKYGSNIEKRKEQIENRKQENPRKNSAEKIYDPNGVIEKLQNPNRTVTEVEDIIMDDKKENKKNG